MEANLAAALAPDNRRHASPREGGPPGRVRAIWRYNAREPAGTGERYVAHAQLALHGESWRAQLVAACHRIRA
jgi:hypothetical protein